MVRHCSPPVGPHGAHGTRRLLTAAEHEVVEHERPGAVAEELGERDRPLRSLEAVVVDERARRQLPVLGAVRPIKPASCGRSMLAARRAPGDSVGAWERGEGAAPDLRGKGGGGVDGRRGVASREWELSRLRGGTDTSDLAEMKRMWTEQMMEAGAKESAANSTEADDDVEESFVGKRVSVWMDQGIECRGKLIAMEDNMNCVLERPVQRFDVDTGELLGTDDWNFLIYGYNVEHIAVLDDQDAPEERDPAESDS